MDRELPLAEILARAKREGIRLADIPYWEVAFRGAEPRLPQKVRGLAQPPYEYYVVDFRVGSRPTGRLILDSRTGDVDEITGTDHADEPIPEFLTPYQAARVLRNRDLTTADGRKLRLDPACVEIDEEMVWKPCDQSRTPFQAFYVAHQAGDTFYIRADGAVFSELTEFEVV